ncbi:MAG: tRNA 2-thiocytidine(32) synthetase TtcA [Alphaproteobacteria bacterium]|nr:tRNA 2-thiocytidine(32) synthetase TtcA [Alphaproteobacteria bacterium]
MTALADVDDPSETDSAHPLFAEAPKTVGFNKLRKRLIRNARQAIETFGMVCPGARWLVALSGGKDSFGLLAVLLDLKWRGLLPVDLLAVNLDQGQPGFPKQVLPDYLSAIDVAHRIDYRDTYSIVTDKLPEGATYCSLCSRLRRGHLYRIAREEGCSALVLGHHREDSLETFFMNLIHGGKLAAMPGKLLNDEGDVEVLRPLIYCAENDLMKFAEAMRFPIIPCNLCGSQDGLERVAMKQMLEDIERRMPGRKDVMIRALGNVRPGHLLDPRLFDFGDLQARPTEGSATNEGKGAGQGA